MRKIMNRFLGKRKRQQAIEKERHFAVYGMETGAMPRDETQTIIMKIVRLKERKEF